VIDLERGWPSERLDLELLAVAHAAELVPLLDDAALHEFTGGTPLSEAALAARYARLAVCRSPGGDQLWGNWVIRVRATGAAAGTVQATLPVPGPAAGPTEVAWVLPGPRRAGAMPAKPPAASSPCCGETDGRSLLISTPATVPPSGSPVRPGSCPPPPSMTARPAGPARRPRRPDPGNLIPQTQLPGAPVPLCLASL